MATPHVGVVIPVYNGAAFVVETLESVRAQRDVAWELVVVDDGSTDGSLSLVREVAAREPRLRLVRQPHRGVSAARNLGFCNLSDACTHVAFIDADDLWLPRTLATLLEVASRHPKAAAAYGLGTLIDAHGSSLDEPRLREVQVHRVVATPRGVYPWPDEAPTVFEVLLARVPIATIGTVLFDVRHLQSIELFPEELCYFEDWDLLLRLSLRHHLWFEPVEVLRKRQHGANVSSSSRLWEGLRQVRARTLQLLADDPVRRRAALQAQRWAQGVNRRDQLRYARGCWQSHRLRAASGHVARALRAACAELVVGGRLIVGA